MGIGGGGSFFLHSFCTIYEQFETKIMYHVFFGGQRNLVELKIEELVRIRLGYLFNSFAIITILISMRMGLVCF